MSTTRWPTDPRRAALVLDFDGTLAPIVDDPERSRMPTRTAATLARLAGSLRTVAIVSGRPGSFLRSRAPVPGVRLFGLYGLERVVGGEVVADERVAAHADALAASRAVLEEVAAAWPGTHVEDKGLGLAVHWRRAEDPEGAAAAIPGRVRQLAEANGLWAEDGKRVIELRPPVEVDKGAVIHEVAAEADSLAFAGDDVGDLPAFAATRALGGLSIAVDHGEETAAAVREAGDVVVEGTDGMAAWLTDLAARLRTP